jgi:hypothetical protein
VLVFQVAFTHLHIHTIQIMSYPKTLIFILAIYLFYCTKGIQTTAGGAAVTTSVAINKEGVAVAVALTPVGAVAVIAAVAVIGVAALFLFPPSVLAAPAAVGSGATAVVGTTTAVASSCGLLSPTFFMVFTGVLCTRLLLTRN